MAKTVSMAGVFPPIPTPFDGAGELNLKALADNLEKWNKYPLAGYVVLGSNGEMPYLSETEKLEGGYHCDGRFRLARFASRCSPLLDWHDGEPPGCASGLINHTAE